MIISNPKVSDEFSKTRERFGSLTGFTLIEIIITIGITVILASMVLTYSSASRDQAALYVEEAKLAQSIARAKSLTLATYNQPVIPCGYGVHLDYETQTYSIFAYNSRPCSAIAQIQTEDPPMSVIEKQFLPKNVKLDPTEESIQDVLFLPPAPRTWIWQAPGDLGTTTEGKIILKTAGGKSMEIKLNEGGQITF